MCPRGGAKCPNTPIKYTTYTGSDETCVNDLNNLNLKNTKTCSTCNKNLCLHKSHVFPQLSET